ncbi:Two Component Transcriptional Regulator, LuxR family [Thiobacillus denitrificans ATCC 25259]|uniref:Two Component Transcriptional Regulator, LuxR family n=1 Tax=Thiobacillus denitrificans (strain ATCC 25259 / T1) TaxID=292415 RepID=Q3SI37_THIDA|nr:response regulator transcription factor [Thiobacillus denitrificans]AAZ97696.1 Two Component Transcriptional Regulator, LuxR family [Thiobacillus denitrificans ATCC 25259]
MPSSPDTALIHIVDDDEALRRSLLFLFDSVGWRAQAYASADEFLAAYRPGAPGCLVLDIRMPGMSGLELQQVLRARGEVLPVIFITGHGDVSLAVQAMKQEACDFLEKPFKDQALLDAVGQAVRRSRDDLAVEARRNQAHALLERLSPREREVARRVARGLPNKLIARELDISEKTVHVHRQHVMEKTHTGSAAELARLMLRADPADLD